MTGRYVGDWLDKTLARAPLMTAANIAVATRTLTDSQVYAFDPRIRPRAIRLLRAGRPNCGYWIAGASAGSAARGLFRLLRGPVCQPCVRRCHRWARAGAEQKATRIAARRPTEAGRDSFLRSRATDPGHETDGEPHDDGHPLPEHRRAQQRAGGDARHDHQRRRLVAATDVEARAEVDQAHRREQETRHRTGDRAPPASHAPTLAAWLPTDWAAFDRYDPSTRSLGG